MGSKATNWPFSPRRKTYSPHMDHGVGTGKKTTGVPEMTPAVVKVAGAAILSTLRWCRWGVDTRGDERCSDLRRQVVKRKRRALGCEGAGQVLIPYRIHGYRILYVHHHSFSAGGCGGQ